MIAARQVTRRLARAGHIFRQVVVGCYDDGMMHAGNLAYMSLLAIFPFFLTGAAAFTLVGEPGEQAAAVRAVLAAMPPVVAEVIRPVALSVVAARSGWLLWLGVLFVLSVYYFPTGVVGRLRAGSAGDKS